MISIEKQASDKQIISTPWTNKCSLIYYHLENLGIVGFWELADIMYHMTSEIGQGYRFTANQRILDSEKIIYTLPPKWFLFLEFQNYDHSICFYVVGEPTIEDGEKVRQLILQINKDLKEDARNLPITTV